MRELHNHDDVAASQDSIYGIHSRGYFAILNSGVHGPDGEGPYLALLDGAAAADEVNHAHSLVRAAENGGVSGVATGGVSHAALALTYAFARTGRNKHIRASKSAQEVDVIMCICS